jgi:hypothetical protein
MKKGVVTSTRVVVRTAIDWCCCDEDNDRPRRGASEQCGNSAGTGYGCTKTGRDEVLEQGEGDIGTGRDGPIRTTTI